MSDRSTAKRLLPIRALHALSLRDQPRVTTAMSATLMTPPIVMIVRRMAVIVGLINKLTHNTYAHHECCFL